MNREIKFRAWMNGKMYLNDSVNINIGGQVYYLDTDGEWDMDEIGHVKLMQYTGLKDKNGKEIYEGDIVNIKKQTWPDILTSSSKINYIIMWGKWSWMKGEVLNEPHFAFDIFDAQACELIGNIYENTELIETETTAI